MFMKPVYVLLCVFLTSSASLKLCSNSHQRFQKFVSAAIIASSLVGSNVQPSVAAISSPIVGSSIYLAADSGIPAIGAPAPDFTLPSNIAGGGKSLSLADLKGGRTVLYFYPGDFTQGCTIEAQAFQRDISKYKALDAKIIGVSVDSIDKHLDFGKTYNLDFPLLSGTKNGIITIQIVTCFTRFLYPQKIQEEKFPSSTGRC